MMVVCQRRVECSVKICRWKRPAKTEDREAPEYFCLHAGEHVSLVPIHQDTGTPIELGDTLVLVPSMTRVRRKPPFDKGKVLAIARPQDTFINVSWQEKPMHQSTHELTQVQDELGMDGPGMGVGDSGYFSYDDGSIPECRLYYVRYGKHSRGWVTELEVVTVVKERDNGAT